MEFLEAPELGSDVWAPARVVSAVDVLEIKSLRSSIYFEGSTPILRVADMKIALAFYVDKLGFQNASWGTEEFTSVNRDRAGIYLCRGGQGRGGAWIWVGVEDATKLHDELVARAVAIRMPLTNFSWALEFHVEDPDGNVLRFGSEPIAGRRDENLPRWDGA